MIFMDVEIFFVSSFFVIPMIYVLLRSTQSLLTRFWPTVTGWINFSKFEINRSNEGTTYKANITYQYEVNGVNYTASRFDLPLLGKMFEGGSSAGRRG